MNYEKIGKFIQEKRKQKELTQKELANKIGVTDKAISKWERSQGCPDVSILEILSKELDCSILELLKGREIENEVISVTEADDYVKTGMDFSKVHVKNQIKNILNKVIEITIICIVLLLCYFNINQIIYIDKEYTYKVDNDKYKKVTNYINTVESNIEVIKNSQGIFSDEDYETIIKSIDSYYDDLNKIKLLKYIKSKENFTYTIWDLRIMNVTPYFLGYERDTLSVLENYSSANSIESYKNLVTEEFFSNGELSREKMARPYYIYQYEINYDNFFNESYDISTNELRYIEYNLNAELTKLIYLTDLVIEVGDISE